MHDVDMLIRITIAWYATLYQQKKIIKNEKSISKHKLYINIFFDQLWIGNARQTEVEVVLDRLYR